MIQRIERMGKIYIYIYMVEITDSFCKPKSHLIVRWLVLKIQRHDSRE